MSGEAAEFVIQPLMILTLPAYSKRNPSTGGSLAARQAG